MYAAPDRHHIYLRGEYPEGDSNPRFCLQRDFSFSQHLPRDCRWLLVAALNGQVVLHVLPPAFELSFTA